MTPATLVHILRRGRGYIAEGIDALRRNKLQSRSGAHLEDDSALIVAIAFTSHQCICPACCLLTMKLDDETYRKVTIFPSAPWASVPKLFRSCLGHVSLQTVALRLALGWWLAGAVAASVTSSTALPPPAIVGTLSRVSFLSRDLQLKLRGGATMAASIPAMPTDPEMVAGWPAVPYDSPAVYWQVPPWQSIELVFHGISG